MADNDRSHATCTEHANLQAQIIDISKDVGYILKNIEKANGYREKCEQEIDGRVKTKSFYVLISSLLTVLVFMIGLQAHSYDKMNDVKSKIESIKFEIDSDLRRRELESAQLIKRLDEISTEHAALVRYVLNNQSQSELFDKQRNRLKLKNNFNRKEQ